MSRGNTSTSPPTGPSARERSGARQMLDARNRAIRQAFRQGVSPEVLGEQYHLSPASIRRIVYTK